MVAWSGTLVATTQRLRLRTRENMRYLVFKLVERLRGNWRALNGWANLMALVLEGAVCTDGLRQPQLDRVPAASAA